MNPWRGLGVLPRDIWILCSATLINRMGVMVLPFLVVYLTTVLGYTAEEAGTILMCYGLAAFVTAPFSGKLSDKIGPLLVMKLSLLITGLVLFLYPLAQSRAVLVIITVLWAAISEAFRPAALAIITDSVTVDQRKAAFALNRLAINLGMSIGPALGGFLFLYSYELLFWVNGSTTILSGLVLVFVPLTVRHSTHEEHQKTQSGIALRDTTLLYFLAAMLPAMIIFFQHEAAMPIYMVRDLGLSTSVLGMMFSVNTVIIILLEVPLNLAMTNVSHRTNLALGAFLTGAGFGAMMFVSDPIGIAATVVVWTFGEMILLPSAATYMSEIAPPERRGEYMGLFQMTFSLAFALSAWVGPMLLDQYGGSILWSVMFLVGCVSTFMLLRVAQPAAVAGSKP
ncbi:MAG: MDR family MFS transporter [Bacteroidota bacterium]